MEGLLRGFHEMVHPLELGPHETFAASAGVLARWWWWCRRPSLRLSSDEGVSAAFTRNNKQEQCSYDMLRRRHFKVTTSTTPKAS